MDVAFILDKYFKGMESVSIDVFDSQTLNAVYRDVVKAMTSHFEIEVSVLQALSYCLYEMMDNVHIHSGKPLGTAMTHYDASQKMLRILIADDGKGIRASLAENERYKDVSEAEALRLCLQDSITDGKGMGFGLYTTSRLVDRIGKKFILHSGVPSMSSSTSSVNSSPTNLASPSKPSAASAYNSWYRNIRHGLHGFYQRHGLLRIRKAVSLII